MLPLDDPRWPELDHREWSAGVGAPDAPVVADELHCSGDYGHIPDGLADDIVAECQTCGEPMVENPADAPPPADVVCTR